MDLLFSQTQSVQSGGLLSFLPFLLIMAILYFFMLRPQAKKQKDKELMISNLSKGDKIITIGGIVGKISGFKEKDKLVAVKVDSNTTVIDLMVQNDTFRGIVSGVIRGARTVRINPTGADTYETVLEIDQDMVAYLFRTAQSL